MKSDLTGLFLFALFILIQMVKCAKINLDFDLELARNIDVIWICGPAGSGKSFLAYSDDAYKIELQNGRFTDWSGHDTILLDNLHLNWISYNQIVELIDSCNHCTTPVTANTDKIYLVSQYTPEETFTTEMRKHGHIRRLLYRISKYIVLKKPLPKTITESIGKQMVETFLQ